MKRLNIGLLMTYNEADVLPQMLESIQGQVDVIYALDGSSDQTTEILQAHPLVHTVLRDEMVSPNKKVGCFHRQHLLNLAREEHGYGHWYTLLHADEFFHDSPRKIIELAQAQKAGFVNWMSMQFFLHHQDQGLYDTNGQPLNNNIQHRIAWYSPFWIEVRQFLDVPQFPWQKVAYREGQYLRTKPHFTRWKPFSKMPILKHYTYRSPHQVTAKRLNPGMSAAQLHQTAFQTTAQSIYAKAIKLENPMQPVFDGFEMQEQKSLLHTFLIQQKLLRKHRH
jgi:hypothetical protein